MLCAQFTNLVFVFQVIVGKKSRTSESGCASAETGRMGLFVVPKYAGEWPQVGKILSIESNSSMTSLV